MIALPSTSADGHSLHVGRTAERLHVSTTRISQAIAKLERRVGVPLFNRTSRRVELTPVGRQMYEVTPGLLDRLSAERDRIDKRISDLVNTRDGLDSAPATADQTMKTAIPFLE